MDLISEGVLCPKFTGDRNAVIKSVLAEIRKEKPLGRCPLFKMSLTFRSFVWTPLIDSIYGSHTSQLEKPIQSEIVVKKKPLLRSHSTTTMKSSELFKDQLVCEDTGHAPEKTVRKDVMRLNMLSTLANTAVSMKSQVKNLSQRVDLSTQRSHKIGAVPKYLTDRKAEWARIEEEKLQNLPDPDCPEGHVRMPDSEKLETLAKLQKSQQELIEEFNHLPLSKDSLRIRQKKEDIEKQLTKVEEGIRVLSKPKVFVRFDC